ncbi:MAG TPA: hypothetical protein VJ719_15675 [Chthoniobacterales bacterium]|nr:hypothetical protein [Chthoniobacterales bacterium]
MNRKLQDASPDGYWRTTSAYGVPAPKLDLGCARFCFASPTRIVYSHPNPMIELEVYAAGVRDLNKILELDHELEAVTGMRYKIDSNHDLVYLEIDDEPTITFREIRAIFRRLGFEPRFVGAIPPELRPRSKTQLLSV